MILVTAQGIEWRGFNSTYEVLGFIDLHINPVEMKQGIVDAIAKKGR